MHAFTANARPKLTDFGRNTRIIDVKSSFEHVTGINLRMKVSTSSSVILETKLSVLTIFVHIYNFQHS